LPGWLAPRRSASGVCGSRCWKRLGGRIFTRHPGATETPVELGAEFIHGRSPEAWEIIERAGLRTHELTGGRWRLEQGRLALANSSWEEIDSIFQRMDPAVPDQSFEEFLEHSYRDLPEEAKASATSYVEGFHASHAGRISVHSLIRGQRADEEIEGHRGFCLLDGMDALVQSVLAAIKPQLLSLRLNTVVTKISWGKGAVEVATESPSRDRLQVLETRAAVATLPLGVLQAPVGSPGALCERSATDRSFPKYPRLPVVECSGYEEKVASDASEQ